MSEHTLPRSPAARLLEALARHYVSLPPENVSERRQVAGTLLEHVRGLLRVRLRRVADRYARDLPFDLDDWFQEADVKVLTLLDQHYRPERGAFVNLVTTAISRFAGAYLGALTTRAHREELVGNNPATEDGSGDCPRWVQPEYEPPEQGPSRVSNAVTSFYSMMTEAPDPRVRCVARACLSLFHGGDEALPQVEAVQRQVPEAWAPRELRKLHRLLPSFVEDVLATA